MKDIFIKPLIFTVLLCTVFACKKPARPIEEPKDPRYEGYTPAKQGTPIGTAIHQTIGPEGGIAEMPNGEISVEIPAGALDKPTDISIQQVSNTLGNLALGKSFKILPEGIKFKKDVRIAFDYLPDILNKTLAEYLSLAFQDEKGYWHEMKTIEHLTGARIIAAETRHFSTWTIMTAFTIESSRDRLLKGESASLSVTAKAFPPPEVPGEEDYLIAPPLELDSKNILGWTTEYGKLSGEKTFNPTFTATDEVTKEKNNLVKLELHNVYDPITGTEGDITLNYNLVLVPDEFLRVKYGDNLTFITFETVTTTPVNYPRTEISGAWQDHGVIIFSYGNATYNPFSGESNASTSKVVLGAGRFGSYQSWYFKCNDINGYTQPGDVIYTKNDNTPGGYRVGVVKGKLTKANWCVGKEIIPF